MSLVEINWRPDRKELGSFGKTALIASVVVSVLLYVFKGLDIRWGLVIIAAGTVIFFCSRVSPKSTRMIYLGLILITLPIGWVVSFILLAAFYFLLLVPVGLIFRLAGRDPLCRKFDSAAKSYWAARRPPDSIDRYFHQF